MAAPVARRACTWPKTRQAGVGTRPQAAQLPGVTVKRSRPGTPPFLLRLQLPRVLQIPRSGMRTWRRGNRDFRAACGGFCVRAGRDWDPSMRRRVQPPGRSPAGSRPWTRYRCPLRRSAQRRLERTLFRSYLRAALFLLWGPLREAGRERVTRHGDRGRDPGPSRAIRDLDRRLGRTRRRVLQKSLIRKGSSRVPDRGPQTRIAFRAALA